MVSVHPHCLEIFDLAADFNNLLSNLLIDGAVGAPVIVDKSAVVSDVQEVVEFWPDRTLVENQK